MLLNPNGGRGNVAKGANDAVGDLLGEDAHSGDLKAEVVYYANSGDNTPLTTNARLRYVTFPPLKELDEVLGRYGRRTA